MEGGGVKLRKKKGRNELKFTRSPPESLRLGTLTAAILTQLSNEERTLLINQEVPDNNEIYFVRYRIAKLVVQADARHFQNTEGPIRLFHRNSIVPRLVFMQDATRKHGIDIS